MENRRKYFRAKCFRKLVASDSNWWEKYKQSICSISVHEIFAFKYKKMRRIRRIDVIMKMQYLWHTFRKISEEYFQTLSININQLPPIYGEILHENIFSDFSYLWEFPWKNVHIYKVREKCVVLVMSFWINSRDKSSLFLCPLSETP